MNQTLEQVRDARRRWQARLTRAVNAIKKLDAKEKRLLKKAAAPGVVSATPPAPSRPGPVASPDPLGIPTFLRRTADADKAAAAAIKAEQVERKKTKTSARLAALKAQQSGETRRMPLTGKAALKRINEVAASH